MSQIQFLTATLSKLAGMLAVVYVLYLAVLFLMQRQMIYPGAARVLDRDVDDPLPTGAVRHWISTSEGNVESWFFPPASQKPAPAVIVAHGNGDLIDGWATATNALVAAGIGVYLVEYPGFGLSSGAPRRQSIANAFTRGYDWLTAQPQVDPLKIAGLGQSLGGGVITDLAENRRLSALILWSSFSSAGAMARQMLAPGFLVLDSYDPESVIKRFSGPVLIIHGKSDAIIPFRHALALHERRPDAQLLKLGCAHNDCFRHWNEIVSNVAELAHAEYDPELYSARRKLAESGRSRGVRMARSRTRKRF